MLHLESENTKATAGNDLGLLDTQTNKQTSLIHLEQPSRYVDNQCITHRYDILRAKRPKQWHRHQVQENRASGQERWLIFD
jgi:hypothetical protein